MQSSFQGQLCCVLAVCDAGISLPVCLRGGGCLPPRLTAEQERVAPPQAVGMVPIIASLTTSAPVPPSRALPPAPPRPPLQNCCDSMLCRPDSQEADCLEPQVPLTSQASLGTALIVQINSVLCLLLSQPNRLLNLPSPGLMSTWGRGAVTSTGGGVWEGGNNRIPSFPPPPARRQPPGRP